ncbi:MAG: AI-2E family transporter [Clostridiales bacterium]|nr:AI-2E family transporter [Clostridiales bacterium]
MKDHKYRDYFIIALMVILVVGVSLLMFFAMFHFSRVWALVQDLVGILMPFIIGFVIAYLLAPLYNLLVRNLEEWLKRRKLPPERARKYATFSSMLLSIVAALCLLSGLVALVVPSFINSCIGIVNSMQTYIDQISQWLSDFFADNPTLAETLQGYLDTGSDQLVDWLTDTLLPSLQSVSGSVGSGMGNVFGALISGVVLIFRVAKNAILGFIVAAYMLMGKGSMIGHCKQFVYGLFPLKTANHIVRQCRYIHQVFGGFIRGKLLDSLVIGIICFIGTSLLSIPYALLISVIIGVTNIIPFFGPFIGAIPCGCLVLLNSPIKCVTFVIFILALQQFDGNILGPKILGDSTGLSSFWVLFAILLFGGLFGFVGMIVGVPIFAVICSLADYLRTGQLKKRHLSTDEEDYMNLKQVDQQPDGSRVYTKMKDPTKK